MHVRIIAVFLVMFLTGCSVATEFNIANLSGEDITIRAFEYSGAKPKVSVIKAGESNEYYSLEFEGFELVTSNGKIIGYKKSLIAFRVEWEKYRGEYICEGPEVNLEYKDQLEAIHCKEPATRIVLEQDKSNYHPS